MIGEKITTLSKRDYESPELFKLLVDGVRDYAMFVLDCDGYIRSWNKGAERIKQYHSSEIIGSHFSIFYTEEDRRQNRPQMLLQQALRDGRVEDEGFRVRKDGTRFFADVIVTALFDESGEHRGFAKVTRDMTERQNLITALEEAVRASQAKTTFLANMSHELRTPLTAIIGYAEMISEQLSQEEPSGIAKDISRILYSAKHLQSTVNDILDLSKIEAGKLEIIEEDVMLPEIVQECIQTITPVAMCNGNELHAVIEPEDLQIRTDKTRLRQILYNLLSNAAKFTHDGNITVRACEDSQENAGYVQIDVIDTGVGMAEEQTTLVFDRFHQVEAPLGKPGNGGTGLGLAICRMLCQAMGGTISATSKLGEGSTFTVKIPAAGKAALAE